MTTAAKLLDAQHHPIAYLGPTFVSTLVQAVEAGYLLSLLMTFWRRNEEGRTIRFIVVFTSTIGLLQACFAVRDMWYITVSGYGNYDRAMAWSWFITLSPLMSAWTGIPVQAFMACRLWMVCNRTFPLLVFAGFFVVSHAIIIVVASVMQVSSGLFNVQRSINTYMFSLPINSPILICLTASAVLDTVVTSLLIVRFTRLQLNIIPSQRQKVFDFISMMIWESGLPACACSLSAAFLYGLLNTYSFWYRPFQSILGKLYVFSLLITLNNRRDRSDDGLFVTDRGVLSSIQRLDSTAPMTSVARCPQTHNLARLQCVDSSQSVDIKESRPSHLSTLNFASLSEVNSREIVPGPPPKPLVTDDDQSSVCGCQRSDCSYNLARESCYSSQTQVVVDVVVESGD